MLDNDQLMPAEGDYRSLVKYEVTAEQIEAKIAAYSALEATTPKGYEEVRKAIGDLRGLRVAIEDRRQELKKVPIEMGRYIDSEAKQLTALIKSIEEPLQLKKSAVDDEKARVKRDKEAAEKAALEAKIKAEREAEEAKAKAARDAEEARLKAEAEKLAAERAEFERQQKEAAERAAAAQAIRDAEAKAIRDEEERVARIERERLAEERRQFEEQKRIEEEIAAKARAKIEADRKAAEAKAAAEQARLDAERKAIEDARIKAEHEEFERQARITAEREAREQAERDRIAAEEARVAELERKAAEEKRLDAIRPDVEKVHSYAAAVRTVLKAAPAVQSEEATRAIEHAQFDLNDVALALEKFTAA